jgi:hypothetical protein
VHYILVSKSITPTYVSAYNRPSSGVKVFYIDFTSVSSILKIVSTKADKGKTIVIMNKDMYTQKVEEFLTNNNFRQLQNDPTDKYQKQVLRIILKCNTLIGQQRKKYLTQIKPQPSTLNAQIKIHKDNETIRPVINNTHAPTYKIAKFLNKWFTNTLQLQNTYVTYNSTQLAHDLTKLQVTEANRMVKFDIKDLYVNIPIDETINITKTLLTNKKIDNTLTEQACILLSTILKQNYLQFNGKFYQPNKGVAMGSPISGLIAELFLQH